MFLGPGVWKPLGYNTAMLIDLLIHWLDLIGTVVFAITGLLAASRKQLDLFGAIVIAMVTAIGGGTLRDLILGVPVFWVKQPIYIYLVVSAALVMFVYARFFAAPMRLLLVLDALGLAAFTIIGVQKSHALGLADPIVIMTGIMTGVVGGMIRDILVGEVPLILRKEIYATAAFVGASLWLLLRPLFDSAAVPSAAALVAIVALRLAAIYRNYALPVFQPIHHRRD